MNPWQRPPRGPVWQRELALVLPAVVLGSCVGGGMETKDSGYVDPGTGPPTYDSGYVALGDTGYVAPGTSTFRDSDSGGYTTIGTVTLVDSDSGYSMPGTAPGADSADTGAPGGSAAPAPIGALPKPR